MIEIKDLRKEEKVEKKPQHFTKEDSDMGWVNYDDESNCFITSGWSKDEGHLFAGCIRLNGNTVERIEIFEDGNNTFLRFVRKQKE